jgi:hypothetical protein
MAYMYRQSCADPMIPLDFPLGLLIVRLVFDPEKCLQVLVLKPPRI